MHPDTWKQSNMLEVNPLCKVQGNEESKKQIFPFVDEGHLFCVVMSTVLCSYVYCFEKFMVICLTMEQCPILA